MNGKFMSYKRKEKGTNLKELPRPYELTQSPPTKRIKGKVQVGKTRLPPIGFLSLPKVAEEG